MENKKSQWRQWAALLGRAALSLGSSAAARKAIDELDPVALKKALARGASVKAKRDGETALTALALADFRRGGRSDDRAREMTMDLLAAGADPNEKNNKGEAPLRLAASGCAAGICQALLDGGAIPIKRDSSGLTALEAAKDKRSSCQLLDFSMHVETVRLKEPLLDMLRVASERWEIGQSAQEASPRKSGSNRL